MATDKRVTDFYQAITTGNSAIPCAFDHFETPQKFPFMVYTIVSNGAVSADNETWYISPKIQLELYTEKKETQLEAEIEERIKSGGYRFTEKNEGYVADAQAYMTAWLINLY